MLGIVLLCLMMVVVGCLYDYCCVYCYWLVAAFCLLFWWCCLVVVWLLIVLVFGFYTLFGLIYCMTVGCA